MFITTTTKELLPLKPNPSHFNPINSLTTYFLFIQFITVMITTIYLFIFSSTSCMQ
jgi:hypothetical protein